jgi:hypothetical protein
VIARTPRHVAGGLLVSGMAVQLVAAQSAVPRYEVKRVSAPLTGDGKLDEPAWAAAPVGTLRSLRPPS